MLRHYPNHQQGIGHPGRQAALNRIASLTPGRIHVFEDHPNSSKPKVCKLVYRVSIGCRQSNDVFAFRLQCASDIPLLYLLIPIQLPHTVMNEFSRVLAIGCLKAVNYSGEGLKKLGTVDWAAVQVLSCDGLF